mgnify:CR=1 FL=1
MSKEPHFSIIMTNFNNGEYIEEAIQSVLNQEYPHWELVIIDDFSTDNSLNVIKKYISNSKIDLIQNNRKMGVGYSKKIGCEKASNDIIGILDSDDMLHKKALKIMKAAYNNSTDCGFIYSNFWSCNSKLEKIEIPSWIGHSKPQGINLLNPKVSHFKTFKKTEYEKTSGYDQNLKKAVDKDIVYKLEEITEFKFINKPLYYYRHHKGGISQNKEKFKARVYNYVSKCHAFKRRLNTNLPNLTLDDLYFEYYKITFHGIITFLRNQSIFNLIKKNFTKIIEKKFRDLNSVKKTTKKIPNKFIKVILNHFID